MSLNEARRLSVLRSYRIIDTPADPAFDRITELARMSLDAPIALISLVDETRQWFKSRQGLDACQTDRSDAFCAHALPLARGEVLVVPDATQDPRFADNPLVTGAPSIRFYAGAVLTSPEGANLGTLCVIDDRPRPGLTILQQQTLRALADLALNELEVARAHRRDAAKLELLELAEGMSGVGWWRLDVLTGVVEWSEEVYRIHGVDPATFDPQLDSALDFYDPEGREALERHLSDAMRDRTGYAFQLPLRRRDGERRHVVCKATCELGVGGEVEAFSGVFQDVTEQVDLLRQVSEDRERYRLLADNANDMIATTAMDSTVLFVTPAVHRLLGYAPAEVVGRRTLDLTHPDDIPAVTALFERLAAAGPDVEPSPYYFRGRHKDGRWIWLEGQPRVQFDEHGRPIVFQDVVRDISERKRAEEELHNARREAEAAAQAKADFLANMSHELRTPLTSILGYTALASEQAELAPLTRDYVRRVQNASRALLATVNDILDFSKLEAGQVELHEVPADVMAVCRDAVELFVPQAAAKDLKLEVIAPAGEPPPLVIDAERLLQLLLNLVGNAVKFTASGFVSVTVRHAGGRLTLEVRDSGPGITPQDQARLFQRFSQVDGSSTRNHGGTGLGLAICKGLAERMGGGVRVDSAPGRGSAFTLDLPAAPTAARPMSVAPCAVVQQLEALRVLVVDDNAANRELARIILAGAGAEVSQAESGAEALATLAAQPVDAVLMDLRMPDLDGHAVLRRLRAEPGPNDAVPVVAYTADAPARGVFDAALAAFDGVVGKPVDPAALLSVLKAAVDGGAAVPEAAHG